MGARTFAFFTVFASIAARLAACGGTTDHSSTAAGDASAADGPRPLCVPNQSIACVGSGGCSGGQACNAEGTAYLPCDCGGSIDSGGSDGPATGCVKPTGTNIGIFNEPTQQNPWNDPATGLSGNLFLDPNSAGSFTTGSAGMHVQYAQTEQAYGQFASNPSFGVRFTRCVDASAFKGITYQLHPGPPGAPAGAGSVLRVLTVSTTPPPYGTCVPKKAGDCTAPYWEPSNGNFFTSNNADTITWDLLAGANPAEPGITAATEIIGLAWMVDEFEGPPPTPVQLDVFLNAVSFVPM